MDTTNLNIIIGESNPRGSGSSLDIPIIRNYLKEPFPAVRIWNPSTAQLEPLELAVNNIEPLGSSFGPELQYATRLSMENNFAPSALVKSARGSSGLDPAFAGLSWDPDTGPLFAVLVSRVTSAIAALQAEGWTVNIRSINCSIGLNDGNVLSSANNFQTRFQNFVNRIYSDLSISSSVPFVINRPHVSANVTYVSTIRTAIDNVAAADSRLTVFSVDDMQLAPDLLHWQADEEIEFGNRFYDNFF